MRTGANAAKARRAKARRREANRARAAVGRAGYVSLRRQRKLKKNFPKIQTRKAARGIRCAICRKNTTPMTRTTLGCTHPFHRRCLYRWVRYNTTCPACRYNFLRTIPRNERRGWDRGRGDDCLKMLYDVMMFMCCTVIVYAIIICIA